MKHVLIQRNYKIKISFQLKGFTHKSVLLCPVYNRKLCIIVRVAKQSDLFSYALKAVCL